MNRDKPNETEAHVESLLRSHFQDEGACLDCDIEGYVANRLTDDERVGVEAHLKSCAICRRGLPIVARAYQEGAHERAYAALATTSATRPVRPLHQSARSGMKLVLALAAALVLAAGVALLSHQETTPSRGLIVKGPGGLAPLTAPRESDALFFAVSRAGVVANVASDERLLPGDRIQFFYTAAQAGYLALVHLASDGEAALLFPRLEPESAAIRAGERLPLDSAVELTSGDGCEWVVAVFSNAPLRREAITRDIAGSVQIDAPTCSAAVTVAGARTVIVRPVRQH